MIRLNTKLNNMMILTMAILFVSCSGGSELPREGESLQDSSPLGNNLVTSHDDLISHDISFQLRVVDKDDQDEAGNQQGLSDQVAKTISTPGDDNLLSNLNGGQLRGMWVAQTVGGPRGFVSGTSENGVTTIELSISSYDIYDPANWVRLYKIVEVQNAPSGCGLKIVGVMYFGTTLGLYLNLAAAAQIQDHIELEVSSGSAIPQPFGTNHIAGMPGLYTFSNNEVARQVSSMLSQLDASMEPERFSVARYFQCINVSTHSAAMVLGMLHSKVGTVIKPHQTSYDLSYSMAPQEYFLGAETTSLANAMFFGFIPVRVDFERRSILDDLDNSNESTNGWMRTTMNIPRDDFVSTRHTSFVFYSSNL